MKKKGFILGVILFGILGVGYGMTNRNHPIFVAGLVLVIVAYLMIRKELKKQIREKYSSEEDGGRPPRL